MATKLSLILAILAVSTFVFAQERFNNPQYGFSMEKPKNWIEAENKDVLKNLEKYKFSDEKLSEILKDYKGSVILTSFYRYNAKTHMGINPTINVTVRANGSKNYDEFKAMILQSASGIKNQFKDFELAVPVTEIEVSGIKAVFFVGTFSMKLQTGNILRVRSRTYAIPYGDYFFQLNFTDGQDKSDNNDVIFDKLVGSIKIGK